MQPRETLHRRAQPIRVGIASYLLSLHRHTNARHISTFSGSHSCTQGPKVPPMPNLGPAHAGFGHQQAERIPGCGSLRPRPKLQGHGPQWLGRTPQDHR
jgi:hypothetical protein